MASKYYGLNRGQTQFSTTVGNASGSTDVEVRFDLTKFIGTGKGSKEEVLRVLEQLKNYILTDPEKILG